MNKKQLLYLCAAAIAIIEPFCSKAQNSKLQVVDKIWRCRSVVKQDQQTRLVEIKQHIPAVSYQLAYATKDNFTHKKLYRSGNKTYLRMPALAALHQVAQRLASQGYGIIVWDAYRPYRVTNKMWKIIGDERYVAIPKKGSGHNMGTSIDLTLFNFAHKKEIDMGTGFDSFSDTAYHSFAGLTEQQKNNRSLLKTTMEAFGFKALESEWWHYSWVGNTFNVLDLSFRQLGKLND